VQRLSLIRVMRVNNGSGMSDSELFGDDSLTSPTEGRAYARRMILLEEAQLKLAAAKRADHCDLHTQSETLKRDAVALLMEIGPRYLMIDPDPNSLLK